MKIQDEARDRLDSFGDDDKALVLAMIHRIDQLEREQQEIKDRYRERRPWERELWALLALGWSAGAAIHLHDGDFLPWFASGIAVMLSMIGALLIITHYVLPALRALRRAISRRMPWADA